MCPSNPTTGTLPTEMKAGGSKRCLHTCVHISVIHSSQRVETTKLSKMMDEQGWSFCTVECYSAFKKRF